MKEFKLIYRKDKINNGSGPIHFRVFFKGKPIYLSSGVSIEQRFWNESEGLISKTCPNSKRLNNQLNSTLDELNVRLNSVLRNHPNASRKNIRSMLMAKGTNNRFFQIAESYLQEIADRKEIGTLDDRISKLNKFKTFVKNDELTIEDINSELLHMYKRYMRNVLKNGTNTVTGNLKTIKAVLNYARKRYKLAATFDPFDGIMLEKEDVKRTFLTEIELNQIQTLDLSKSPALSVYRDMFIFSAKGFGIRVSDMLLLRWANFDGTHLNYKILKTRKQNVVKASPAIQRILANYRTEKSKADDFIFPILDPRLDYNDEKIVDIEISRATARYNKGLKVIAKKANISKNITTHVARHTFATLLRSKGVDMLDLRDLLRHSNVRETEVYASTVDPKMDKLIDRLELK